MSDSPIEIKYVSGTQVYLDEDGQVIISVGYTEVPGSHQMRIVGSFAATTSVAETYCRQLMNVLGMKEDLGWDRIKPADETENQS